MKNLNLLIFYSAITIQALLHPANLFCYDALSKPQKMIVNVAVTNLRGGPEPAPKDLTLPMSSQTNPLQASQLLLGEQVIATKFFKDNHKTMWLKVNAIQQERYDAKTGWHGLSGWIKADHAIKVNEFAACNLAVKALWTPLTDVHGNIKSQIAMATRLHGVKTSDTSKYQVVLPDHSIGFINAKDVYPLHDTVTESIEFLQQSIVATARKFIGNFYCYGGRCPQNDALAISSVDCSSFINLVFLAHGLQVPTCAHDQYLKSAKIKFGKNLQPADLIFFCPENSAIKRMTHVMMYIGNGQLIEATLSGASKVQIVSFKDRIGKLHTSMKSGDLTQGATSKGVVAHQFHVYFGSFLQNHRLLQNLRDKALSV
jgi:hypothetical protein